VELRVSSSNFVVGGNIHPKQFNYDDPGYESYIRNSVCIVCHSPSVDVHHVYHARRNSYLALPLCREHHTTGQNSYHTLGVKTFEGEHNLDLMWEIVNHLSQYIDKKKHVEVKEGP